MKAKNPKAFIDYRTPEYDREIRAYLNGLKKSTGPEAIKEAREGLIRTGVADKYGHVKEKIVSWE